MQLNNRFTIGFLVWLLCVAAMLVLSWARWPQQAWLATDFQALLPSSSIDYRVEQANLAASSSFDRQVIWLVQGSDSGRVDGFADVVISNLEQLGYADPGFEDEQVRRWRQLSAALYPYRWGLLAPADRGRLEADSDAYLQQFQRMLYSPLGAQALGALEWELDIELRAVIDEPCRDNKGWEQIEKDTIIYAPLSEESAPGIGQIRLFSPCLIRDRPAYAVLLNALEQDLYLAVPYGRFSEPCLPGELLTGRTASCLRVLCLWNAVEISSDTVRKSWFLDNLSNNELDDARLLMQAVRNDLPIPDPLKHRTGPPQWHPSDPRVRYMAEERVLSERLSAGLKKIIYPENGSSLRKAAEGGENYEVDEQKEEEEG